MTKRKLGISIYPDHSDLEKDKQYLKKAASFGFSRLFMSMLEIKNNRESVINKFSDLIKYAKSLHYEVILDIAPNIFNQLDISYDNLSFFSELGADGIRLDEGFDGKKEAMLSFNNEGLTIELNMSNDVAYLDNILTYQANRPFISGCHNFYPQEGTGLPLQFFEQCSKRYRKENINTAAFVSSQVADFGPWDINDGLPTLELHRHLPVDVQCKHLFATGLIDSVIIGNSYASEEELKTMGDIDRYQTVFKVKLEKNINPVEEEILLKNQHVRRGDITNQVIRSTEVRKTYRKVSNVQHDNRMVFKPGDIVVGNNQFGKYKNELQIVLEEHQDSRKNRIGQIVANEQFLLKTLKPWSKFKFEV